MNENFRQPPENSKEQFPISMTRQQFDLIGDNSLENTEVINTLSNLHITISDDPEPKFVKISVDGDIKHMCINRNDFGTIYAFAQ